FVIATVAGLLRQSDQTMRNALVAETMPSDRLMATMGVLRTTQDSARIAGSLVGAGLFAVFGIGAAYLAVSLFYGCGFLMTLGVGGARRRVATAGPSIWHDLIDGLSYVARDVYHIDQTGLGTLVASFALGSLIGSVTVSVGGRVLQPARMMIVF